MNVIKPYMPEKGENSDVKITGRKRYKNKIPMLKRLK